MLRALAPRGGHLPQRCFHAQVRSLHVTPCIHSTPLPSQSIPPPLAGLKVVDLTRVLAGPYCTMLLADLGADVIKIEHPSAGDDTRSWYPPSAPLNVLSDDEMAKLGFQIDQRKRKHWETLPPESAYFLSVNRNKRSIGIDLKKPEGRKIVQEMIKNADVVVENYLPGKLSTMQLGYEDAKAINPSIVYASITGYGQTGPYASMAGYDVIIAADAGLFHITGEKERPPVKIGVAMTDLTTGLYVHGAIMAALLGRGKTGQGIHIDASLFESQIASLVNVASSYLVSGQEASRWGTAHPSIVPYQVLHTKNGLLMVGAGNDGQFRKLCAILGEPALHQDERFSSNKNRVANRQVLIPLLESLLEKRSNDDWLPLIQKEGIPVAPIRNIRETFEHPQSVERGVTTEVIHPRAGPIKISAPAVRYGESKMAVTRPPPVLGQHTEEVLAEMGYDSAAIEQLREKGAIGN